MDYCKCYKDLKLTCGQCFKPYKLFTTKQDLIDNIKKKINICNSERLTLKLELADLENEPDNYIDTPIKSDNL